MAAVMFDTQKFVERLQAAKFSPAQAKAQSAAMREVLETAFANRTKEQQDISVRAVEALDSKTEKALLAFKHEVNERFIKTDAKIDNLALGLRKDMSAVEERLNGKIVNLEERLNGKMSSLETGLRKDMEALGNKLIIRLTLAMLGVLGVAGTIAGFALRAMMMK